jgi:hypothetical protein
MISVYIVIFRIQLATGLLMTILNIGKLIEEYSWIDRKIVLLSFLELRVI